MTFHERQLALLADLLEERAAATDGAWRYRLDQKIADMREAIYGNRTEE